MRQFSVISCLLLSLIACSSAPDPGGETPADLESTTATVEELLDQVRRNSSDDNVSLALEAIQELVSSGQFELASDQAAALDQIDITDARLLNELKLLQARLALQSDQAALAIEHLQAVSAMERRRQPGLAATYYQLLGQAYIESGLYREAAETLVEAAQADTGLEQQALSDSIWQTLNQIDTPALTTFANQANNYALRGWIELARVYRNEQFSIRSQLDAVNRWLRTWNQHPAVNALPTAVKNLELAWQQRPQHIALILPLQQPAGIAIQEGFLGAYYRALEVSREVPRLSVYDSSGATAIFSLYDEAVSDGADLVIGPLNKTLVTQLHQQFRLPVPTLALNYADSPEPGPANLYQYGLAPEDEIRQTAEIAWQAGYRNAAVLTPGTEDYLRLQDNFARVWNEQGGHLVSRANFDGSTDYAQVIKRLMAIDSSEARAARLLELLPRNNMEFTPRRRSDIDFIFLIANPRQGRQIKPTLAFYFAEDLPVYALPSINDGLENESANRDLDGIVFTDAPWVLDQNQELRNQVDTDLRPAQGSLQRLRAMGIDSFMLYTRLSQFSNGDLTSLHGSTGQLTMSANRQIHRQLPLARFRNGRAERIPVSSAGDD